MRTRFLSQPTETLGRNLIEILASTPPPTKAIFVCAFSSRLTLMRIRALVERIKASGGLVRVVAGIDLDGTSEEALQEILRWGVEAYVVKNPNPRNTFHPKIYLFEQPQRAQIFVGSNNLTEGGFFTNYEATAH